MAKTLKLYCVTCKGRHVHHALDNDERKRLRAGAHRKNVDGFFACDRERPDGSHCGTLRTAFNKDPLDGPKKLADY